MNTLERSAVLAHASEVPSKYKGVKAPPRTLFKLYLDPKTNTLQYQKQHVIDLRWNQRTWQTKTGTLDLVRRLITATERNVLIHVERMARRHGKTFKSIHDAVNALPAIPRPNPIMAYYCPEKGQAVRNAWAALEAATRHIPNVSLDKTGGVITFPRPTIANPQDYCTIYLLPLKQGKGSKKGQYYDICIVDEADLAEIEFIKEVCIISCSDRGGILELKGTPDGHDRLNWWLQEAKKKVQFRLAFERGEIQHVPDEMTDFNNWSYFESDAEKEDVYNEEELKKLKALLGETIYNNQMLCKDVVSNEKFYFRQAMAVVEEQMRSSVNLRPVPHVPIRAYYDVGIGSKSDRMAFVIAQHFPTHMSILWSWDEPNASYAEVAAAIKQTPFFKYIYEHVLPHDMRARQQSDKKEKWVIFEEALRKYGIFGEVRTLIRTKDPKGDLDTVRSVIGQTLFNSVTAASVIEALNKHARKLNQEHKIYEDRPSKTIYRDLADAYRHAAIDFETKEYVNHERIPISKNAGAQGVVDLGGVEHSFKGSIMFNDQGGDRGHVQMGHGNVPSHLNY